MYVLFTGTVLYKIQIQRYVIYLALRVCFYCSKYNFTSTNRSVSISARSARKTTTTAFVWNYFLAAKTRNAAATCRCSYRFKVSPVTLVGQSCPWPVSHPMLQHTLYIELVHHQRSVKLVETWASHKLVDSDTSSVGWPWLFHTTSSKLVDTSTQTHGSTTVIASCETGQLLHKSAIGWGGWPH